ncbi:MAG: ClpP family protease [Phycisphaerae bacterium]
MQSPVRPLYPLTVRPRREPCRDDGTSQTTNTRSQVRARRPPARVMIHQPLSGARGPATDIKIELEEVLRTQKQLYHVLAKHTGKSIEQIEADCDRNNWMDAEQAIAYGLADRVLESMPEKAPPPLRPLS